MKVAEGRTVDAEKRGEMGKRTGFMQENIF
jgi:hypothetical protein